MSLKRPYSSPEPSSPPQSKRRHVAWPFPSPPSSSSPVVNMPHTPRRRQYPIPFDSPTNPFGRKHNPSLSLPRTTTFGKHLPLHFQLIRDGVKAYGKAGVYRIVQVPLNYTFKHLHKLLLFLFGGQPVSVGKSSGTAPRRSSTRRLAHSRKGKAVERENQGHIFEVQKSITMYNMAYKPGQIRSARTRVKLSSVRDPYRYRGEDAFAGYGTGGGVEISEEGAEGEDDEWRWEAEEDFLVSHAWPQGGDLTRGIVYHHDSHTQVHITVNTSPIPPRKGVGNKPFVIRARGLVHLYSHSHDKEEGEMGEDKPEADLVVDNWNDRDAFDKFLRHSNARAKREEEGMDEDLGDNSIYPPMADISNLSGISDLTTPGFSATDSSKSDSAFSFSSSPLSTPITPFPRHPLHALRVEHAHRQMVRLTKRGMQGLDSESDEEEEDVDELSEDVDPFGDEVEL